MLEGLDNLYDSMRNERHLLTELLLEDCDHEYLFENSIRQLKALVPDLSRAEVDDLIRRFIKFNKTKGGDDSE